MPLPSFSGPPCVFVQGDTVIFTESKSIYPATDYTLAFALSRNGVPISNTAAITAGDGKSFLVKIDAAHSALLSPGRAQWTEIATATAGGARYTAGQGFLTITPDPLQSLTLTPEMVALASVKQAIADAVLSASKSRNFNGQMSEDRDMKDLFTARDRLQIIVNAQLAELGLRKGDNGRNIIFSFPP